MDFNLYECSMCNMIAPEEKAIEHFIRSHVPIERAPWSCGLCGFKTLSRQHLTKHERHFWHQNALKRLGSSRVGVTYRASRYPYRVQIGMDIMKYQEDMPTYTYETQSFYYDNRSVGEYRLAASRRPFTDRNGDLKRSIDSQGNHNAKRRKADGGSPEVVTERRKERGVLNPSTNTRNTTAAQGDPKVEDDGTKSKKKISPEQRPKVTSQLDSVTDNLGLETTICPDRMTVHRNNRNEAQKKQDQLSKMSDKENVNASIPDTTSTVLLDGLGQDFMETSAEVAQTSAPNALNKTGDVFGDVAVVRQVDSTEKSPPTTPGSENETQIEFGDVTYPGRAETSSGTGGDNDGLTQASDGEEDDWNQSDMAALEGKVSDMILALEPLKNISKALVALDFHMRKLVPVLQQLVADGKTAKP